MTLITLTHANTLRPVSVSRELVFAVQYSDAHKCTHIISNAGAIIPVSETVQRVNELVYGLINKPAGDTQQTKEMPNGV